MSSKENVAMPSRAFLFSPYRVNALTCRVWDVAMPSRAFLFSPYVGAGFNRSIDGRIEVAMPSRAFLFSP